MVGLPAAGKTTAALRLEAETGAVRFSPDDWQYALFGHDIDDPEHDARHTRIEALIWEVAAQLLRRGIDVILDFGFWSRAEREAMRSRAAALGARCQLHYLPASVETLWRRLEARNRRAGQAGSADGALPVFRVSREELEAWAEQFEAPDAAELAAD